MQHYQESGMRVLRCSTSVVAMSMVMMVDHRKAQD